MGTDHAEATTRQVWGNEVGKNGAEANAHGQGKTNEQGQGAEYLNIGVDRAHRPGRQPGDIITGGILAQLIAQVEDQLGEAVECVEWYHRSVEKYQRQLESLKQLQQMAEESGSEE